MTLEGYLEAARRRLSWRKSVRVAVMLLVAALTVSAIGGWLVMTVVPSATAMTVARVLLYAALGAAVAMALRRPVTVERAGSELERRVPAFGGRLVTWLDASRRGDGSALFRLLDRQTRDIADGHEPARVVPTREIAVPAAVGLVSLTVLVLLLAGSHPWQLAGQRLWAGGLLAGAQPGIDVQPGNAIVRRGSDVVIDARARGFRPEAMSVHADFGNGWEQAPMSRLGDGGFGFVFVGVSDAVSYYVASRGLTSTRHVIDVAELPQVTAVRTSYRFPAWTGLQDARRERGDVSALPGTRVEVDALTDVPVEQALLVVNGEALPMTGRGSPTASTEPRLVGEFEVTAPGSWHVAVRHQGELARISDSYLIDLAEDAPPELVFAWPGRDSRATAIEEVLLDFDASDDYGIESLTLSYAVNGGPWQQVDLPDEGYLLRLETLSVADGDAPRGLVPGDVVSLYAEATDHSQRVRSALYFVDVRPFDMRYRESQQMSGQGGGEGGGLDIAERQRDILTATWNLINRQMNEPQDADARRALADEAEVLALLQRTLAQQVETLISRSSARGLGRDDDLGSFITELTRALESMEPAAARLADMSLEQAVPSEQLALKHLVTAEASVRDVDVSLSRNQARGTSGRSLSELVELELDPQRNRYEMPQQPGLGDAGPADADDRWRQLEELAARQEELARRKGQSRDSLPARWEQARLRRELDRLREALESGTQTGSAASGSLERAIGDVDRARRALDESAAADGPARAEAQAQAAEALRRASGGLRDSSRGELEDRLARSGRRIANLQADQDRVMEALETLQQEALDKARSGDGLARGDYAMQTFADVKRRMQADLSALRAELTDISGSAGERGLAGADVLDRALRELDEARVDERLSASAEAFDLGQPLYVIGSEALVQQALERLGGRVAQAEQLLTEAGRGPGGNPLEQVRDLRRRLADAAADDGVDRGVVDAVVREIARLGAGGEAREGRRSGAGIGDTGLDGEVYRIRGTADQNTATLLQLALERLDLIEAALTSTDVPPIRAQQPREAARDSTAAARYFRALSRSDDREGGLSPQ